MAYVQLGDICNVIKGEIGITNAIPGDYPMVTTGEFRKSHDKFQLDTKAVLVPLVSATGHGHASIKRIHYQEGKFAFGSILAACTPKNENYSAKFLYIYFNLMKDYVLVPLMKGSANVSLTLGNLKTAKVPDISLETQLKIVELYSKIKIEQDKATDLLVKQKDDIASLRQSILQEAIQGKLTINWRADNHDIENASILLKRIRDEKTQLIKDEKIKKEKPLPPIAKEDIPYELPEGWVWCRVGEVTDIIAGASFKSGDFNKIDGVKCIKITNAGVRDFVETDDYLPNNFIELYPNYLIKKGDLILALTRPYIKDGLKISICPPAYHNSLLNQRVASIRSMTKYIYHPYVFSFIQSPMVLNHYKSKFDGKSQQPNMKMGDITNLLISIPPIEEQKVIIQKVNELMVLCDGLEQQLFDSNEQIEQLMQSVLREVFEGEKSN
ncbi:restriction endonuclease subunit S [Arenibacter echinorum]|uniref:Type I restriction enzyme S subunit n=1 Tax=Arenibacter echinorum TaxID=440515 RepID=A0A327R832_9FLAO|nr:restriction endonuclease subunit S [Arenibacter echinorum]RAJ11713.1 type I restriction enzyme S subunit [Arenibacter echinorum]